MGSTWSSPKTAAQGSRVPRSASPRVVPGATSPQRGWPIGGLLRAALHRGRVTAHRPAPVELSPLAHALHVLGRR